MKKKYSGFSLFEVLITLFIFSVSLLGLMQLQLHSWQQIRDIHLLQMNMTNDER